MLRYTAEQAARGLLQTDFALIDQDDNHAVISVRIDRKKLADNHNFLALLSDLASVDGTTAQPPPLALPPSRAVKWKLTAALLIGIMIPSPLLNVFDHAHAKEGPPTQLTSIRLETPVVVAGQDLAYDLTKVFERTCPSSVQREFVRTSDGSTVYSITEPTVLVHTEHPVTLTMRIAVHVPEWIPPGGYTYRSIVTSHCDDRDYFLRHPDMAFEVGPESPAVALQQ